MDKKDINQTVGKMLRSARKLAKLSQTQLARKVKSSKSSISGYESGDVPIPSDVLYKICTVLHITPNYFFGVAKSDIYLTQDERSLVGAFRAIKDLNKNAAFSIFKFIEWSSKDEQERSVLKRYYTMNALSSYIDKEKTKP